jgi:polyvinyl alcohol dehydrogenase (cytochrome)
VSPVKSGLWAVLVAGVAAACAALAAHAQPAQPSGEAIFQSRCKACHDPAIERAPGRAELALKPQSDIVQALTNGVMAPMAQGLTQADIHAVAAYLSLVGPGTQAEAEVGREGVRRAAPTGPVGVDPKCASNPPIKALPGDWPTTGLDDASTRFQRHPGLTAAQVPQLKVKWAFSMSGGGQPTVVGDWLFVTNQSGKFYALDAKTGCVHWVVGDLPARTTPIITRSTISPSGWLAIVGESDRIIRTFDAQTGKEIWRSAQLEAHPVSLLTGSPIVAGETLLVPISSIEEAAAMSKAYACCTFRGSLAALDLKTGKEIWRSAQLEAHPVSLLTGSPIVAGETLLVPISSIEEAAAMSKAYACCTFRGSLAALDLKTGKLLWKTYTIDEPLRVHGEKEGGGSLHGPAGAAIWSAPSVDLKRGLVYVVTGDSYTKIDTKGSDSIFAIEIRTGKVRWHRQVTQHDNFVMGCGPRSVSGNCPDPLGPDHDFGATPVLVTLHGGQQVLVAGQKSGLVYGLNPSTGELLWKTAVGVGSALGGVEWGIGADDHNVYVPISDVGRLFARGGHPADGKPGVYALNPANGAFVWQAPAPEAPCHYAADKDRPSRCVRAQSAAPAIMPGAVFEGGMDGWFRAYDSATGKVIWAFSTTAQTYDTVNGVKGQPGGSIDGMGPTIAHGMVYVMSGHNGAANIGSNGVNVLLAFSVDGK